ncbi:MAG: hypothetical protein ACI3Z0_10985 [Candidatus Cryptobacteroides sp.]
MPDGKYRIVLDRETSEIKISSPATDVPDKTVLFKRTSGTAGADAPGGTGKVKISDWSDVLYIKASWSAMNPEDGVYIWDQDPSYSDPARRLHYLVDGARERGMRIAFTINTNSIDKHENYEAAYVFTDDGADISKIVQGSPQTFETTVDLSGVSVGRYTWATAIVHKENNNRPGIELSVKDSYIAGDGWTKLCNILVK